MPRDSNKTKAQLIAELEELRPKVARSQDMDSDLALFLVEESIDPILAAYASTGIICKCNRAAEHYFGYSRNQLIGKHQSELHPPEETDREYSRSFKKHREHPDLRIEAQIKTASGEIRPVSIKTSLIKFDGKSVLIAVFRDLTDSKAMEKRYAELLQGLNEAIFHMSLPDGVYDYMSPASKQVFGYSAEEWLKKPKLIFQIIHPDFIDFLNTEWAKQIKGNITPSYEYKVIGPAGEEHWISQSNKGVVNSNGEIVGIIGSCSNITVRKKTQETLRAREDEYKSTLNNLLTGVVVHNSDSSILFSNTEATKILGLSQDQMTGKKAIDSAWNFVDEDLNTLAVSEYPISKVLATKEALEDYVVGILRADKDYIIWALIKATPIFSDNRELDKVIINFIEITELKQAKEKRKGHVRFLKRMEEADRIIRKATTIEQFLQDIINLIFEIFDCDRAWLLTPCDPEAEHFSIPIEKCKAEYPGKRPLNTDLPVTPEDAFNFQTALEKAQPVTAGDPDNSTGIIETEDQFDVKSQLFLAIHPQIGKPWLLGMHQCSYTRHWEQSEKDLFQGIGHRIADGLSNLIVLQNLKISEQRLQEVVAKAPVPMCITKANGDIEFFNESFIQSIGYTLNEIHTAEDWWQKIYPDPEYRKLVMDAWSNAVATANETGQEVEPQTWEMCRKDGELRTMEIKLVPLGEISVITMIDMTDQLRLIKELSDGEMRLMAAQRIAHLGAWEWDIRNDTIWLSDEVYRIFGYHPNEFDASADIFFKAVHPEDLPQVQTSIDRALKGLKSYNTEHRIILPDGQIKTIHTHGIISYDDQDNPILMEGVIQDISKRKELERQLIQASKMESIGQLAAGIAHEINTPTQFIELNMNFLRDAFNDLALLLKSYERLKEMAESDSQHNKICTKIEERSIEIEYQYILSEIPIAIEQSLDGLAQISRIVQSVKSFSHLSSHQKVETYINDLIEMVVTVSTNEWKYHSNISLDLDKTNPLVFCVPDLINQALLNLVVNAAHTNTDKVHTKNIDKVGLFISTKAEEKLIRISIRDEGMGIPEEIRNLIFNPFFTTKELGKGTGQGLTLAYRTIVEEHGGTINFETAMGSGTTFTITLPRLSEKA